MQPPFVIDGSVLCADDAKNWDYDRLRAAINDIRDACGDKNTEIKVFVDASLRYKLSTADKKKLEVDLAEGLIEQTPAGLQADVFILRWAETHGAIVVTNDLFRDWVKDFPWISQPGSGRFVSGIFDGKTKKWTFLERHAVGSPRTIGDLVGNTFSKVLNPTFQDPTREKYRADIARSSPTAIVFLLDQSSSMGGAWTDGMRKRDAVAQFVNDTLYELLLASTRQDGVRPYLDISVIGYGGEGPTGIRYLLPNSSKTSPFVSVIDLEDLAELSEVRRPTGTVVSLPTWIKPHADGLTPMSAAMIAAAHALKTWVMRNPASFPPIVFNITDGESTDGDPSESGAAITELGTSDGNVLLFTAHISNETSRSIRFPENVDATFDTPARTMFSLSSHIPSSMRMMARELGIEMPAAARGFLYNANAADVALLINVGTPGTQRMSGNG